VVIETQGKALDRNLIDIYADGRIPSAGTAKIFCVFFKLAGIYEQKPPFEPSTRSQL
jgi:hypothetical protein